MANIELKFNCLSQDGTQAQIIPVPNGELMIKLSKDGKKNSIILDKSTAIKFAKTLRTEINKIDSNV